MEPSRNFDLRLSGTLSAVSVEVTDSPAGQTTAPAVLPCTVSPQALEDLRDAVPGVDLKAIGSALWRCAFGAPVVAELWRASRAEVGSEGILRLRLTIDAFELMAVPWELLYDETLGRSVALDGQTPVTRFTRLPMPSVPWPQDRPLHLLFTGSSPSDMPTLNVAEEWAGIEQMIAPLVKQGRLETPDPIPEGATLPSLLAALRRKVDIWHFAGHGTDNGLIFCKDHNKANPVDAGELGHMLRGEGVRLAVINACRAGAGGGQAASVAGALLRANIPSVVAMQANVSDVAADTFAGAFYDAIAVGQDVDQAVTSARKAIWAAGTHEWWTPALFMRTPEGRIWRMPVKGAESEARARELAYLDGVIEKYKYWAEKYTPLAGIAEVREGAGDNPRLDLPMMFMPAGFERLEEHGFGLERRTEKVPVDDLREAVAKHKRLVILGEPGAGKTTTLWRLAYDYAVAARSDPQAPLPLLVPLGAYSGPESVLAYAQGYFEELGPHLPVYLRNKRVILLLDALNEMPRSDYRERVGRVKALLDQYPDTPTIVTCRALDYVNTLKLEKLNIKPLDVDRQREYLHRYLGETEGESLFRQMGGAAMINRQSLTRTQATEQLMKELIAVAKGPPGPKNKTLLSNRDSRPLLALGHNPYMLMITAQVYAAHGGVLPQNRGRLFATFVDTLLGREEERCDPAIWPGADTLRLGMTRLAYTMHETEERGTAVDVEWATIQLAQPNVDVNLIVYLCASATLLDKSNSQVRFVHQLVQEYFVALEVLDRIKQGDDLNRYWPKDWTQPSGWEETFILLAGILPDMAPLINQLLPVNPLLAARCITESGGERPDDFTIRQVQERLVGIATSRHAPVVHRNVAGDALNLLGDPRPGVGVRPDGLPDIVWVEVPAGEFIMGNTKGSDPEVMDDEMPQQRLWLNRFFISKYPITNAQFDTFVQDGGYTEEWRHCWTEAGWQWKGPKSERERAQGVYNLPNHPVIYISWYEAIAFCNWLSEKLGRAISLPSEAEWEKAARHTDGRSYPWGDELTADHTNFDQTGIGTTSAVGIFPKGESRCGALDMCGNTAEWCLTKSRDDLTMPPDNNPEGDDGRVMRGSAFHYPGKFVRCTSRHVTHPWYHEWFYSFRVAVSSSFR